MSRILLHKAKVKRRHVVFGILFCLMINITPSLATSEYESNDSVAEKELSLVLGSNHGSRSENNSQVVSIADRQNNVQEYVLTEDKTNSEKALLFTSTTTSRTYSVSEKATDGEIQVVTGVWEEGSNNNSNTKKQPHTNRITSKHYNTSKADGQDAQNDKEGRNEEEMIGQEVGGGGGGGGGRSQQDRKGKREEQSEGNVLITEGGENDNLGRRKDGYKRTHEVQNNEGKEEREEIREGREEKMSYKKRGVSGGGSAGEKEKEKNEQRSARHDGGEKLRAASGAYTGIVGAGGNIRETKGVGEEGYATNDREEEGKREAEEWTDWFVEGKAVDVMVSPVLTWTSQPSPKSIPPPAQGMPGNLTLVLRDGSKALTIDLHPTRDLLAATYRDPVIGSTKGGGLAVCEYQGEVRGLDGSWVALSLCPVIRGMVVGGAGAVWVEPGPDSRAVGDPHRVYTPDLRHGVHHTCGVTKDDIHSNFLPDENHSRERRWALQGGTSAWTTDTTRFVELVLVADNSFYEEFKDQTISRCKSIVNVVNAVYRQLGVVVVLTHLEIWKSSDEIEVSSDSDATLKNFSKYRRKFITEHPDIPNDNMQLLTIVDFDGNTVGKAQVSGICSHDDSVGVVQDNPSYPGVVNTARTLAHELGHNLGLNHDVDDPNCDCPSKECIMMPETGGSHLGVLWSECSERNLTRNIKSFSFDCLRNEPSSVVGGCGDGVIGDGEECDCGPDLFCKDNHCCDSKTCKLTQNATCGTGSCCDLKMCKPKVGSALCREARSDCDVPEYCVGGSEFCPPDLGVSDGTYCDGGKGRCYDKWCGSRELRCRSVWGKSGRSADPNSCYGFLNLNGDQNGNCGTSSSDPTQYLPCAKEDVLCGTLHCEADESTKTPNAWFSRMEWQNVKGSVGKCHSLLAVHSYSAAHWLVPNGAPCGSGKWCVDQRCVSTPVSGWVIGFWIFLVVSIILLFLLWDHIRWWWEHHGRTCLSPHIPACTACMDTCCCPCMTRINRMLAAVLPSIGPVCKDTKPKQQPKPQRSEANGTVTMDDHQTVGLDATTDPWGDRWPKDEVVIQVPSRTPYSFGSHHPPANGIIANGQTPQFISSLHNPSDNWPVADRNSGDNSSDRLSQLSETHSEKGLLEHFNPDELQVNGEVYIPSNTSPRIQPVRRAPPPPTKGGQNTEVRGQADETKNGIGTDGYVGARYENIGERPLTSEGVQDGDHSPLPVVPPRPQYLPPRPEHLAARPEIPPRPEVVLPLRPAVVLPNRQKPDVPPRP